MRKLLLLSMLLTVVAVPAAAQYEPPPMEVFGGYTYFNSDDLKEGIKGGQGEFVLNLGEKFGLVFDVGIQKKTVTFLDPFQGPIDFKFTFSQVHTGFRYYWIRNERFSVFGHILTGGLFISSAFGDANAGVFTPGGGVEINISRNFAVRPAQVDAVIASTYSGSTTNMRYAAGVVYRFGD